MEKLNFLPVADADLPLITQWLKKDHVAKWYHEPEDWLAEIAGRNDEYSWLHHFIVYCGSSPIGFCQYYDCYSAKEEWYAVPGPEKMYSIDYLIGEEAYLGKGYGRATVAWLTSTIAQTTPASCIVVQPEEQNLPSCRALLSNGYQFSPQDNYYYIALDR